ncbi:hypothetical protein GUJ93_ZPchr0006g41645 [Zizania palustris]|uniref:Uncharacterized protein n=1 Tax=Zizania palustris TaxID=103762 RepID=A0A8J5W4N5_ZIZPA|nr:hypothetical protein GUJ93_ZPchr0006g41645 [Zizania palustris]
MVLVCNPLGGGCCSRACQELSFTRKDWLELSHMSCRWQVPILVMDSSVLAPYVYGDDYSESEEEDGESDDEGSESEMEDEGEEDWTSNSEAKSGESDEDDDEDALNSVEELKKSVDDVPCTIDEFSKLASFSLQCLQTTGHSKFLMSV